MKCEIGLLQNNESLYKVQTLDEKLILAGARGIILQGDGFPIQLYYC